MNDYWEIGIHEECPTDATLYLKHPNGEYKIALIEGDFWRCLSGIAQYYDGWSSYIDIYDRIHRLENPESFSVLKHPISCGTFSEPKYIPVKSSYGNDICELIWNSFKDETRLRI